jgi:hypothetical protein
MPIVLGAAAVLWMLLVLAVVGAVLVGIVVASTMRRMLPPVDDERNPLVMHPTPLEGDEDSRSDDYEADLDEADDWVSVGWSNADPGYATAWWWSPEGSAPELVIDTGRRPGASAVAEPPPIAEHRIWTIHPDHTAHYMDEAGDCPWCRNDPAS